MTNEMNTKKLYRNQKGRMVGGVCSGLADYLAIDVTLVRILWVALTLANGVGFIAYLICLVLIPKNPEHLHLPASEQQAEGNWGLYFGIGLVLLGLFFLFRHTLDWFHFPFRWFFWNFPRHILMPSLLILLGALLVLKAMRSTDRGSSSAASPYRLMRSRSVRMISGVCGGFAKAINIDVTLVRVAYVILTFFAGFWLGILAYIVCVIVIPEELPDQQYSTFTSNSQQTEQQS